MANFPQESSQGRRDLHRLLEEWSLLNEIDLTPARAKANHRRVQRFLWSAGITDASELNFAVLQHFIVGMQKRGLKPGAIRENWSTVHAFGRYCQRRKAVDWAYLSEDLRLPKVPDTPPRYLDEAATAEVVAFSRYLGCEYEVRLGLCTGLRRDELRTLKWSNFNLPEKFVGVVGKGDKYRGVPLITQLANDLAVIAGAKDDWVFPSHGNHQLPRSKSFWDRQLRPIRAKVPELTGSWHMLRKTFATRLAQRGVSIALVQAWLGHAQVTTTMRYYVNARQNQYNDEIEKLM